MPNLAATLFALVLAAGAVHADPALDPAKKDAAAKLVEEGTTRLDRSDFQGAFDRYREAFQLYPSPRLHFNLALALEGLGRRDVAADEYALFLDLASDAPAEARGQASRQLANLDHDFGQLAITSNVSGALVSIDGAEVGPAPVKRHFAVGSHVVRIAAPGRKTFETTSTVTAGATLPVAGDPIVDLVPVAEPRLTPIVVTPPPQQLPPPERRDDEVHASILGKWWFWGAVGVVVLGGAVITYEATRAPSPPSSELGVLRF